MKMKTSHLSMTFALLSLPLLGYPNRLLPQSNFLEISFPFFKNGVGMGGGRELYVFI